MKIWVLTVVMGLTLVGTALALDLTYHWSPPTTGSPAVEYQVEWRTNSNPFEPLGVVSDTSIVVTAPDGVQGLQIRVAGRDQWGRQGLWSAPSEPFNDAGAPGEPGTPVIALVAAVALGLLLIGLTIWGRLRSE